MKSAVLPSFWSEYRQLSSEIRQSARKAYWLWAEKSISPLFTFQVHQQSGGDLVSEGNARLSGTWSFGRRHSDMVLDR